MSIQEGASEIVFACYRSTNMTLTGNSAAKDSAVCRRWRLAGVRSIGAKRCIELGTYTPTLRSPALALPTDGTVIACDVSTEWTAVGQPFWRKAGVADRIDLRIGPGLETLDALLAAGEAGRFDFAFIDADKPNYPLYYERLLKLVRRGGLIAVDNTLALSGAPIIGDVPVVAASRREAALHSARQADAERVRRELQRQVPRILSRSELVHEPRGRSPTHRALA